MIILRNSLIMFVILVFSGCDNPVKAKNNNELIEFVKNGNLSSVRLTIDADKKLVNLRQKDGDVPLIYFAASNNHKDIIEYLLAKGADVNALTNYGSALHVATEEENESIVLILLKHGANPNLKNSWKMTPLHYTNKHKQADVTKLLIKFGANVNAKDFKGRTPLHRTKSLEVTKTLVLNGANVNAIDDSGYTPLHWAATPREIIDRPTIEYLLSNGADTTIKDKNGLVPRQLAEKNDQKELILILDAEKHKNKSQDTLE